MKKKLCGFKRIIFQLKFTNFNMKTRKLWVSSEMGGIKEMYLTYRVVLHKSGLNCSLGVVAEVWEIMNHVVTTHICNIGGCARVCNKYFNKQVID